MPTIPQLIVAAAQRHGLDPRLAVEVAQAESRLNQSLISRKGAIGVMQLMPATAAALGVNPHVLEENIEGGVRYLRQQLDRFGDVAQALAAYNWGPERVAEAVVKAGAEWLARAPAETRDYVAKILKRLGEWTQKPSLPTDARSVRTAVEQFRGLTPEMQTVLILVAIGVSVYALAELWSD